MSAPAASRSFRLPNGLLVHGLSQDDTLGIYHDIFDDDCYRRHGVTVQDGDCILDVGANTGLFTLYLNSLCTHARIYAFEPIPAIFRVLKRNVAAHNHLDVQLFNVGLSQHAGSAIFTYYPHFSQASTMHPDKSARAAQQGRDYLLGQIHTLPWVLRFLVSLCPRPLKNAIAERVRQYYLRKESVSCRLWNLSQFLREHNILQVDLLKVDAEQSEQEILAGLDEKDWPKIRQIVVEVHQGEKATREIMKLLSQHGFKTAVGANPAMPGLSLVYGVRRTGKARE